VTKRAGLWNELRGHAGFSDHLSPSLRPPDAFTNSSNYSIERVRCWSMRAYDVRLLPSSLARRQYACRER